MQQGAAGARHGISQAEHGLRRRARFVARTSTRGVAARVHLHGHDLTRDLEAEPRRPHRDEGHDDECGDGGTDDVQLVDAEDAGADHERDARRRGRPTLPG